MYDRVCVKAGCDLFDRKNYEASNGKATLRIRATLSALPFAVKVVMVTVGLRPESRPVQLL